MGPAASMPAKQVHTATLYCSYTSYVIIPFILLSPPLVSDPLINDCTQLRNFFILDLNLTLYNCFLVVYATCSTHPGPTYL